MTVKLTCIESPGTAKDLSFEELRELLATSGNRESLAGSPALYCLPLVNRETDLDNCFSLLSEEEKKRADRFSHAGARKQFIMGHGVINLLLKWYLGNDYSAIEFSETEHHKPFVQMPGGSRPLEFNLSHCEDYIAVAIGSKSQGIDIEYLRPLKDLEGICRQVFTEREIAEVFSSGDEADRVRTFFKFWTCKEAALKANGTGFMKDPKTLELFFVKTSDAVKPSVYWSESIAGHSLAWAEDLQL